MLQESSHVSFYDVCTSLELETRARLGREARSAAAPGGRIGGKVNIIKYDFHAK
jgi:hypothetical protein